MINKEETNIGKTKNAKINKNLYNYKNIYFLKLPQKY